MIIRNVFDELFVLEMANNHWGRLDRGLKIISDFSKVVRFNNVRAAVKLWDPLESTCRHASLSIL